MRKLSTTVIGVVGEGSGAFVERLGRAANVVIARPDAAADPLERAIEAWSTAERAHAPYFVHDADPLGAVADAWVRYYDEQAPRGDLEVHVTECLARWRARRVELPDYYLVLDAEAWTPTRRHWFLGVLHRAAPTRVVPVPAALPIAADSLSHLPTGRWWPDVDRLLDGIENLAPDAP